MLLHVRWYVNIDWQLLMTDIESDMDNNTMMKNNNIDIHDDHDDNNRVNDDALNNSDDENECPTIVNGLLTFVMSLWEDISITNRALS